MPTSPSHKLDAHLSKIRHTAELYRAASANPSSPAFAAYLAALEELAEYVTAKSRVEKIVPEISAARQRLYGNRKGPVKQQTTGRVLQFVARSGATGGQAPFPAA